ncbi:hypothetical protein PTKIN_Ptkin12aG0132700 [Pterospermum kingtungense]
MAVKKVYGTLACPATMRVLASLFEHGLEFDFISIDLKSGDHTKDSFLSLNPFGQVPVYQDDQDLTLFESRAAMRFISHHYLKPGKEQIYEAPKQQGIVAAWIDVEDHQFDPPASKLRMELLEKPQKGLSADKQVVEQEEVNLARVLDVYEERLKQFNYLGGDKFTSADLTHLPNLYYLMKTPVKRLFDERPYVSAWCTNLLARPAWVKVVDMVEKK